MPFERYLAPPLQGSQQELGHDQRQPPLYQEYASHNGSLSHTVLDHLGLDASIFTNNVQFQMPQLMLGPTVAPGGGAEVLPAGMVGHTNSMASAWLTNHTASRYGEDYFLSSRECQPSSEQVSLTQYYQPAHCQSPQDQQRIAISRNSSVTALSSPPSPTTVVSSPTDSSYSYPMPPYFPLASSSSIPISLPYSVPSVSGLPIYSASGFDLLSVLARVATRPNPKIALGPVDMTCSFAVVDTRRFDHPIVYASPTFYKLTGYSEPEVIGRNCRFLQSPDGNLQKGDPRRHTAPDSVAHFRKSLAADKECQISLINYRKNGTPFINLVTVIPVPGGVNNTPEEADDVVYHVGFQVDLTEQPNAILQKLRDGSYMVNYSNNVAYPAPSAVKDWKVNLSSMMGASKQFRSLLSDQDFVRSVPLSISTTTLSLVTPDRNEKTDPYDGNRLLSLVMLECSPDFIQVLSLKGAFLYVAPSVRHVLGYEPDELAGKSITDYCHPADTVPLMRELKESSTLPLLLSETGAASGQPKVVDLLFRMQAKSGDFVWIECRGRLHVEPGKGRKAIILSGRVRSMPSLQWGPIARAGGLRPTVVGPPHVASTSAAGSYNASEKEQEFWALLSNAGSFLFVSAAVRDVLGWGVGEVMGRVLGDFVHDPATRIIAEETLSQAFSDASVETRKLPCQMKRKDGSVVLVEVVFYHPPGGGSRFSPSISLPGSQRRPLVCQVKVYKDMLESAPSLSHAFTEEVFDEFDISRGSSWQYELQQLKYANQRLLEEIDELESQVPDSSPAQDHEASRPQHSYDNSWSDQSYAIGHQTHMPMKRSWDGKVIGGSEASP